MCAFDFVYCNHFGRSWFYYSKIKVVERGGCCHLSFFANTAEKLDELKAYLLQDNNSRPRIKLL